MTKRSYTKPPLDFSDQLELLESRGLVVDDRAAAIAFLEYANYYRFSAYCLPYESARHVFLPGATFEQVKALYEFDRKLRDLLSQALEAVEIHMRTRIAHTLAHKHGAFAHLNRSLFYNRFDWNRWHDRVIEEAKRSSETFVEHFRNTYTEFPDMPIWCVTEIMSFGALSTLFKGLERKHQKPIAQEFGVPAPVLQSWLHTMTYLRNLCAHHSRMWNRILAIKPSIPRHGQAWQKLETDSPEDRIFRCLCILRYLLKQSDAGITMYAPWGNCIVELLAAPPNVPSFHDAMGVPGGWERADYWKVK